MGKQVGTWVYDNLNSLGDSIKALRLEIVDEDGDPWGTAVGLGWVPTLECRKAGESALFATVTGDWEDATERSALFLLGTVSALVPTTGTQSYEGQCVLTYPGRVSVQASDDQADTYLFSIRRWP